MSSPGAALREIEVTADPMAPDRVRIAWRFGEELVREARLGEVLALHGEQKVLLDRMACGDFLGDELAAFGLRLGRCLAGEENAPRLLESLSRPGAAFSLVRVAGDPAVTSLAWEALRLPGPADEPVLFLPELRGRLDFARSHSHEAPGEPAERHAGSKCLASISLADELMVQREVEELRDRLLRHPGVRFRWVLHPDLGELQSRLSLECSLFLHAGHGSLQDGRYEILLRSGSVDARDLLASLERSRAEVLIFDCCDSGLVGGLPALLDRLPSAACLLGMQGPTFDSVSCWHMPALVDRLFVGEPVWSAVSLLRVLLYEQGSDAWITPVLHLKRTYRPFQTAQGIRSYLNDLARLVKERKGRGGPQGLRAGRSCAHRCARSTA